MEERGKVLRPVVSGVMPHFNQGVDAPADSCHFGFWASVFVGPEGATAADSFEIFVCTLSWLVEEHARRGPASALKWMTDDANFFPGLVLMSEWSDSKLRQAVDREVAKCGGGSWRAVGNRISRFMEWEFEHDFDQEEDLHFDPPL
jgi:hypothetical protein